MDKDLEKELQELLDKHKKEEENENEFKGVVPPFIPFYQNSSNDWLFILLLILFFANTPNKEEKQPIININLGDD